MVCQIYLVLIRLSAVLSSILFVDTCLASSVLHPHQLDTIVHAQLRTPLVCANDFRIQICHCVVEMEILTRSNDVFQHCVRNQPFYLAPPIISTTSPSIPPCSSPSFLFTVLVVVVEL